ncbi:MAG: NfeD family protein [Lachnospiraceae bacterium]|nr:NfeD family protein [Lachnospiraceae bacterium]
MGVDVSLTTIWLILFVVFIVAEVATAGALVSIWFCIGSLAAMIAARAGTPMLVQVVVFLVVSIALLILTKPFIKKVLKQKNEPTNADVIIGRVGVVVEDINNFEEKGAVKIDGKVWTARSLDEDKAIQKDIKVKIVKIQGVKVLVEEV